MPSGIFSRYQQDENRVTSSLINVFARLPINLVDDILTAIASSALQGHFKFQLQPKSKDGNSIPDAEISANFRYLIETKIQQDALHANQLTGHLNQLGRPEHRKNNPNHKLICITPDASKPAILSTEQFQSEPIEWASFSDLSQALSELMTDTTLVISERDQFLMRELQLLFEEMGLLPDEDQTLIVAARFAHYLYLKTGLYVCQANRAFRKTQRMGFYCDQEIKPELPIIRNHFKDLHFDPSGTITKLIEQSEQASDIGLPLTHDQAQEIQNYFKLVLRHYTPDWTAGHQIFVLDLPSDCVTLKAPIKNNLTSSAGRRVAFTMGQRYVAYSKLKSATNTQDLVD